MHNRKAVPALATGLLTLLALRATGTVSRPRQQPVLVEPTAPAKIAGSGLTLRVEALETLWIAMQVDGKPTFEGRLSPREATTAKAQHVLDVTLGNVQGATLTLNGEPLEPIGGPGEAKTVHITVGDSNTPSIDLLPPSQPGVGAQGPAAGNDAAQPPLCEALSQKVHQARADNGASLAAAWRAAVAERARKHASVWEDACVVSTMAGIQGLRAEALEARHIPVQPDQAYIDSANQIRAIDSEIARTAPDQLEILESLKQIRATLEALETELLPNLVKVEAGKPVETGAGEGWEPAATITNRSSVLPLFRIRVPLEVYDRDRKVIWLGAFSLERLDAGNSAEVSATGALIPANADATFFKVGAVRLSVE